jgi:UPF0271 protein
MGLPFLTTVDYTYYITPEVFDEIKHIKKNIDGLDLLLITKKVILMEASKENILKVKKKEIDVGRTCLSEADYSVIALAIQLKLPIISIDFSLVNLAKHLSLKVLTPGKKNFIQRSSIKYCSICKKFFTNKIDYCEYCGNRLINKRKD